MKNVLILLIVLAIPWINVSGQGGFGPDQYICADGSPASIPCVENGDWWNYQLIESGDGYFDGYAPFMCPWALDYYPGPGDLQNGQVDFCLILYNNWGTIIFYDCITFFFIEPPIVYAGEDQNIQEGDVAFLEGEATNYATVIWSTDGDGNFEDATSLETTYFPGEQDVFNGSVDLCLSAEPLTPCNLSTEGCVLLTFFPLPSVFAGEDATICVDENYQFNDAYAQNYSSVSWLTFGDGTFNDPYTLFPTYTPGTEDINSGYAEICLEAFPLPGSASSAVDCMILSIFERPFIDLPSNVYLDCEGYDFQNED